MRPSQRVQPLLRQQVHPSLTTSIATRSELCQLSFTVRVPVRASLSGFKKPQGVLYVEQLNKLFVASGDDAMLRVFRGDTLDLLDSIQLEPGPNRLAYEPHAKLVYVGRTTQDLQASMCSTAAVLASLG